MRSNQPIPDAQYPRVPSFTRRSPNRCTRLASGQIRSSFVTSRPPSPPDRFLLLLRLRAPTWPDVPARCMKMAVLSACVVSPFALEGAFLGPVSAQQDSAIENANHGPPFSSRNSGKGITSPTGTTRGPPYSASSDLGIDGPPAVARTSQATVRPRPVGRARAGGRLLVHAGTQVDARPLRRVSTAPPPRAMVVAVWAMWRNSIPEQFSTFASQRGWG